MSNEQKHVLLLDENIAGANCGLIESLVQRLATRWIVAFRRRLLVSRVADRLTTSNMVRPSNLAWVYQWHK
jgi:hypothetical protein